MPNKKFISIGRPLKGVLFLSVADVILLILGIWIMFSKSIIAIILGVMFVLFSAILFSVCFLFVKVLKNYVNIEVENDVFVISPIDSVEKVELQADEILSIDFFVLPILNAGHKDSSHFNYQIKIITESEKYIVYCKNKEEFKVFINENYPKMLEEK